jgi:hypothetical protein
LLFHDDILFSCFFTDHKVLNKVYQKSSFFAIGI